MEERSSFGYWLRRNRKAIDLTQSGLAQKVGCSLAAIRKIEADERRPSAQIANLLADIFNISQDERTAFLRFARGEWRAEPSREIEDPPWQISARAFNSNLPAATSSLIGREQELSKVYEYLLDRDIRLVTLVGPPGVGKTRLSIDAAHAAAHVFPDGVFFVTLVPLDNPTLLASAVSQALGYVTPRNISAADQLMEGIGDKQLLLVLDNCEHLIESVASLASDLLARCPRIKILASSRESLRIPGEWLYTVPVLKFPPKNTRIQLEDAPKYPAVILFAERARAVQPDFALNTNNIALVSNICTHVDGLPLAIELIAVRIRLMPPQTLLERLDSYFILSLDGMRSGDRRQRALNNAIGWSYNLLSPEEQALFGSLSVFSGGVTLNAAETIFSRRTTEKSVSDLLTSLLDKSLLQRISDECDEPRFTMLATVQQFALNRLQRTGKETKIRNWHSEYFFKLSEEADHEINGPHQIEWLSRLHSDRDNLGAALEWMVESGQTEAALKMARNLSWFWFKRSDLNEGRRWFARIVALPDAPLYPESYADVLCHLANHTWMQVGPKEARPYAELALAVARSHADKRNTAQALMYLGLVITDENNFTAARTTLEESRRLFHELGNEWEESAHVVLCMALGPYIEEDWAASLTLQEQALEGFRKFGDVFFQCVALRFVGDIRAKTGDPANGIAALKEALTIARELDSKYEISALLWSLGNSAQTTGDHARAVRLYWAAKGIDESIGTWWQEKDVELKGHLATCRAALEELEFASAEELGRNMTMQQSIEFALKQ